MKRKNNRTKPAPSSGCSTQSSPPMRAKGKQPKPMRTGASKAELEERIRELEEEKEGTSTMIKTYELDEIVAMAMAERLKLLCIVLFKGVEDGGFEIHIGWAPGLPGGERESLSTQIANTIADSNPITEAMLERFPVNQVH